MMKEELRDALASTIIQLGILNYKYCNDDPRTIKDLNTIENWIRKGENNECKSTFM